MIGAGTEPGRMRSQTTRSGFLGLPRNVYWA